MPIDTFADLNTLFANFISQLEKYHNERASAWRFWLKDKFRRNLYDAHSQTRRLATATYFIEALKAFTNNIGDMQQNSQTFVTDSYKLLTMICETIETINEPSSALQKILCEQRDKLLEIIKPRLQNQPAALHSIQQIRQQHYNHLLANELKRYVDRRVKNPFTAPQIFILRMVDAFSPKKRDARMQQVTTYIKQLQSCKSKEDYQQFITDSEKTIASIADSTSDLRLVLSQIRHKVQKDLANERLSNFIVPTKSKSTTHTVAAPKSENHSYFRKRIHELFIYRVIGHGVVAGGVVKREEGLIGKIGLRVCVLDPRLPGTSIAAGMISSALQAVDQAQIEQQSNMVIDEIPYHMVQKIADVMTEKLSHRFAAQIASFYHSEYYSAAIDKFINSLLDNILSNIKNSPELEITDVNLGRRYLALISAKQNHALTPAQAQELETITAELIANKLCVNIAKSLTRLPFASYLPFSHLMHQDDKHGLFGGKAWNVHDIFSQPGYAVVDDNQHITFYSAAGLNPQKYGYILISAAEMQLDASRHLLKADKVTDEVRQQYQSLHKLHLVKKPRQDSIVTTGEITSTLIAKTNPVEKLSSAHQDYADKLKGIFIQLQQLRHPLSPQHQSQLLEVRKLFNTIKHEIKKAEQAGDDKLREKEVIVNASSGKILLGQLLKVIDSKLLEHEKLHANCLLDSQPVISDSASMQKHTLTEELPSARQKRVITN